MDPLTRLVLMLALIGIGVGARRVGLLDHARTARLNAVTFYAALPALVFVSTYDRRPAELVSVELLGGVWLVMAATVVLAWVAHRRERSDARRSVALVQSYHSNFGYIGLPLVTAGLGAAASGQAAVLMGVGALTQIPLTTILLVRINGTSTSVLRTVRRLATNPVIAGVAVGLVVATLAWSPPAAATEGLWWLSRSALPLALLCVGASLTLDVEDGDLPLVGSVVALKVVAMPAMAFLAFTALGASPTLIAAGVVMFGAPTAVSSYIYAGELGGDRRLASTNILATTVVGVLLLSWLLVVLN